MSRIRRLLAAATETPWAILPQKLDAIGELLAMRSTGEGYSEDEVLARLGGEAGAPAKAAIGRGVAVLPLYGVIAPRMDSMSEMSGGTSTERFGAWFDAAMADEAVSAIVIDANSPGGSVLGVEELARKIYSARGKKPITAVVNHMAASAAYWVVSACDEIVASLSAQLGNIGIIAMHADTSEQDAKAGVKITVLSAGEHKAEGHYGPLTPEAEAAMNALMATYYSYFTKSVARGRGVGIDAVRNGFGQGRIVTAADAVAMGMADRIGSLEETIARFTSGRSTSRNLPGSRAARVPDRIAAALLADPASSLSEFPVEYLAANAATPLAGAVSGDAAPVVVPVTIPAPEAKEHPMSVPDVAATGAAAATTAEAVQSRIDALAVVAKNHPEHASLSRWIKDGLTPEAANAEILAQVKAELAAKPVITGVGSAIVQGPPNEAKRPFASFGDFCQSVVTAYSPGGSVDPRLALQAAASGMSQGVPAEGGFLVLPEFSATIYEGLTSDPHALLGMTDNYTVDGESLTFPANAETSRATGSRFGGIQGYWINEADQLTKSKPKLRSVKVEPQQLAVLVYLTEKLIANSATALEQYVTRAATEEITFLVGDAIINGTGAGQPKGIMSSGCLISVAKETSQAAATFTKKNVNKMWARMHPRSRASAVWLMNVDVEPQLDEFSTAIMNVAATENVGGFGSVVYNAEKNTLKGRPIIPCEFCATLGTTGDVILADMKGYLTGTRGNGVQSAMSMHLRFDYLEQAFRFVFEVDGQTWLASALTPFKGSNTLSSFVKLDTRA